MAGIIWDDDIRRVKGRVDSGTVISGGSMVVGSGGTAVATKVRSWGTQRIVSGGTALNAAVSGGTQAVSRGGLGKGTKIYSEGWQDVWSGGTSLKAQVFGGIMDVYGGTVKSAVVHSGGRMWLNNGRAKDVLVKSGAVFSAGDGASAALLRIESGGAVQADANRYEDVFLSGMAGSKHFLLSGGTASGFVLWEDGRLDVGRGGRAVNVSVRSGGFLGVSSGGRASGVKIFSGGSLACTVDGTDRKTYVEGTNPGGAFLLSGATASGFLIGSGARISVRSGGSAVALRILSGGRFDCAIDGKESTFVQGTAAGKSFSVSGGVASGVVLWGGSQTVRNGGMASAARLSGYAVQTLFARGAADGTIVASGASQFVMSGGRSFNARIHAGGVQQIGFSGRAADTVLFSGGVQGLANSAAAVRTKVLSGARQVLGWSWVRYVWLDYGIANKGAGAVSSAVRVDAEAYRADAAAAPEGVRGASPSAAAGAGAVPGVRNAAADEEIFDSAPMVISESGGVAYDALAGAKGGVVYDAVVYPYYPRYVYAAPVAKDTDVRGGLQDISAGSAVGTLVHSGGLQMVRYGGTALKTRVEQGGRLAVAGGMARRASVSGGGLMDVFAGGRAEAPVASGGWIGVSSGGAVSQAAVKNGGRLVLFWGGETCGAVVHSGGAVSALAGALPSGLVLKKGAKAWFADGVRLNGSNSMTGVSARGEDGGSLFGLAGKAELVLGAGAKFDGIAFDAGKGSLVLAGRNVSMDSLSLDKGGTLSFRISSLRPGGAMLQAGSVSAGKASLKVEAGAFQRTGSYVLGSGFAASQKWSVSAGDERIAVLAAGKTAEHNGVAWSMQNDAGTASVRLSAIAGAMLKAGASGGKLAGASNCDVFANGAGNDSFSGNGGRDCAVYGSEAWGQDEIASTKGAMTLVFSGLKEGDVETVRAGSDMVFMKKSDSSQKITVQGWNAESHGVVFASGPMKAFRAWASAASPTAAAETAARRDVWRQAKLA